MTTARISRISKATSLHATLLGGVAAALLLLPGGAASPAHALTLTSAPTSLAVPRGSIVANATVDGARTAASVDVLRAGAVVATGAAGANLVVPIGDYTVRIRPSDATLGVRTVPVRVEARTIARPSATWSTGSLRVQVFVSGLATPAALIEVFRPGEPLAAATAAPGTTLRLEAGAWRVRVNRAGELRTLDVTVTAGALRGLAVSF